MALKRKVPSAWQSNGHRSKLKTLDIQDEKTIETASIRPTDLNRAENTASIIGAGIEEITIPNHQSALLLHAVKEKFALVHDHHIPVLRAPDELLIKIHSIGLNPIDWKGPDYNFGIPTLPFVAGRDIVGVVIKAPVNESHIKRGDVILTASTDYRDLRKAAYQHFAVATESTVSRLPRHLDCRKAASLGVAAVSAALALGICFGVDFSKVRINAKGPNLLDIVRGLPADRLSRDVKHECLEGVRADEEPKPGDWIVVWGGTCSSSHDAC